nr:MFS transporter [Tsukamurella sp. PLM1]
MAMVTTTFEEEARTRALAWWTAMSIAGGTAGNLCGGVLTEVFGWRSVLLVNVPLGVIASTLVRRASLPAGSARSRARRGRLDVGAAALVTTALMIAAFGLGATGERRWTAGGAALVTAVILFAAFVRRDRRSPLPMVPAGVLKGRVVRWGNVGILLAGAALVPMWFFLSLQLQVLLGYPPVIAGLAFLPHTVIQLIVGLRWTPLLLRRFGATVLVATGSLLLAAGFAWQSLLVPESSYVAAVLLPAVLIAVGAGVMNLPLTTMTVAGVPDSMAGTASGIMNCAKQIGGGIGLAVLVAATAGMAEPATAYGVAFVIMAGLVALIGVGAVLVARIPRPRIPQPGNGSSV